MLEGATGNELTRSIGLALLAQPFPLRREIEFAAALAGSAESTCYYDAFWLDQRTVVFCVMRLRQGGLKGAMSAAALKELMRAAMARSRNPVEALETCLRLGPLDEIDAAIVMLDLRTGRSIQAASGSGEIRSDEFHALPLGPGMIAPGMSLRLTVGVFEDVPRNIDTATIALSTLAEQMLSKATSDAVAGVVLYKRDVQPQDTELLTLANDVAEISSVLDWVNQFCALHAIDPQSVAGMDLAVDEILTNIISYAYTDGGRHLIDVELCLADNFLSLEIRDDGLPFDPTTVPPPELGAELADRKIGGLGMHFVRSVADEISYRRDRGWNILRLTKNTRANDGNEEGPT